MRKNFCWVGLLWLWGTGFLWGAGSVTYGEIEALVKDSREFESLFAAGLRFEDRGQAARFGRTFGDLQGQRVGPYRFAARFPADRAGSFPYQVTLETEWTIVDGEGRRFREAPPAGARNLRVEERLRAVKLEPLLVVVPEEGRGEKESAPVGRPDMSEALAMERAKAIYAEINGARLQWTERDIDTGEPIPFSLKTGKLNGKTRQMTYHFDLYDHGGRTLEVYYDEEGRPAFAFYQKSYWRFVAEEKTRDTITERRFYFLPDGLVRTLEKNYEVDEGQEAADVAQKTQNQVLEVRPQAARRVWEPLRELFEATPQRAAALTDELRRAQERLKEPDVSTNFQDWGPVRTNRMLARVSGEVKAREAALTLLMRQGVVSENQEEAPQELYGEVLGEKEGEALVLVTLEGLPDDSVAAVRYLTALSRGPQGWTLRQVGGQYRGWPDRTKGPTPWQKSLAP